MVCTGNCASPLVLATVLMDTFAENDQLFPDHVRNEGQKYLEENKVEHEIQVYPGVPHGTENRRLKHGL